PDRARYQRVLTDRGGAGSGAVNDGGRRDRDHDVLRRGKGGAEVQRDGRSQGGAGSDGAVPFERPGVEEYTGECDLGGTDQNIGGAGNFAIGRDAESACGARAVEAQRGPGGSGQHGGVLAFGGELGDYRRDALRGLRI